MASPKARQKRVISIMQQWLPLFGFGGWQVLVDEAKDDGKFASVRSSIEEEWLCVTTYEAFSELTPEQQEHVLLHELSHVLLAIAASGEYGEEVVCNRIASMLVGSEYGVRSLKYMSEDAIRNAKAYFDDDEREVLLDALPHLIVRMDSKHRELLCALFYDGKSLSELARDLGMTKAGVQYRRDRALEALRAAFVEGGA